MKQVIDMLIQVLNINGRIVENRILKNTSHVYIIEGLLKLN